MPYTNLKKMPQDDINKEILEEIKEMNQRYLQLAADFSTFKNEQDIHNLKMRSYLEDDTNSKREGVVTKIEKIETRIIGLEKEFIKKSASIAVGASGVVLALKWIIGKLII